MRSMTVYERRQVLSFSVGDPQESFLCVLVRGQRRMSRYRAVMKNDNQSTMVLRSLCRL